MHKYIKIIKFTQTYRSKILPVESDIKTNVIIIRTVNYGHIRIIIKSKKVNCATNFFCQISEHNLYRNENTTARTNNCSLLYLSVCHLAAWGVSNAFVFFINLRRCT